MTATKKATPPMPTPILVCTDAKTPFWTEDIDAFKVDGTVLDAAEAFVVI